MKKRHNLAIAAVTVGIGFGGVSAQPADAAIFDFNFLSYPGTNQGSLSFSQSGLSGVGVETAALSDLPNAVFSLNYSDSLPLSFSPRVSFTSSNFLNPSFTFNNGNLVGITGVGTVPVTNGDSRDFPFVITFAGSDQLSLMGNTFKEFLGGMVSVVNVLNGQTSFTFPVGGTTNQGKIAFTTVEPITPARPVPEPLTCAGTAVAGGIGWLMKRKKAKAQKVKA